MKKKLKDIIYPTIKKQFDKLSPHYNMDMNGFYFGDGKGNTHLVYNRAIGLIVVSMEFFYLKYFGVDENYYNNDVAIIFMDLVHERLGDEYEFWAVKPEDVIYDSFSKFN